MFDRVGTLLLGVGASVGILAWGLGNEWPS